MKRAPLLVLPLIAACADMKVPDVTSYLSPYRIDIRQGNLVTQEMVAQLRPGLTKEQVRFILGTPLVADIFHADRWDYVYRMQHGTANAATSGKVEQRRLVVFFENGKLIRVGGDVVGEDPDAAEPPKPAARIIEIAAPKKDEAKKEEKKEEAKPEQPAPSN